MHRILSISVLFAFFGSLPAADYSAWKHSLQVQLNTSATGAGITGNQLGFPVLVRLNASIPDFSFDSALATGADLRFAKTDGTPLPYEIELWDKAGKLGFIWVRVDTVFGNNSTQYFLMYFGNSAATSLSNGAAVFDTTNGYAGVWHLAQTGNGTAGEIQDATGRHSGAARGAPTLVDGPVGKALRFSGANDIAIQYGADLEMANYTVESWHSSPAGGIVGTCFGSDYGFQAINDGGWIVTHVGNGSQWFGSRWEMNNYDNQGGVMYRADIVSSAGGFFTNFIRNQFNINNATQTFSGTARFMGASDTLKIGNSGAWLPFEGAAWKNGDYNGIIDEVRISRVARDTTWLRLCYMNQKAGQNFVAVTNGVRPVINVQPRNLRLAPGNSGAIGFTVQGESLVYAWYKVGTVSPVGADAALVLSSVPLSLNGSRYFCRVSNVGGAVTTDTVTLTVYAVADSIEAVTGARTKVVWEQSFATAGTMGWDATTSGYRLLGMDTRGLHPGQIDTLVRGPQSCWNPWITYDGTRVIFTEFGPPHSVYIVNWDGTGKTKLSAGLGLCYWRDPQSGQEWVYFGPEGTDNTGNFSPVQRFRVDSATVVQTVWSGSASIRFTVSADGKYAVGESPWPTVGVFNLQAATFTSPNSQGCNSRIAPDNSYRFFHYPPSDHDNIQMYDSGGANPRLIRVAFSGNQGGSWAPRWSNDVRIMTINAPIEKGDIYIGKFNAGFTAIARRTQVSFDLVTATLGPQNTYAYAWIDPLGLPPAPAGVTPSGLHPGNGLKISRAPNGDLQVTAPGTEAAQLRLLAPDGRLVLEQRGNSGLFRVPRASLGTGIYVVQVQQPGGRFSRTVAVW